MKQICNFASDGMWDPNLQALLRAKEKADPLGWQQFQQRMQTLKLQRTRVVREAEDMQAALQASTLAGWAYVGETRCFRSL